MKKIRKAFVMAVSPGFEAEYKKRHDEIWPELTETLKKFGASNYSIYLHPETRQLFAYVEIQSEELWQGLAATEVCRRWWKYMSDIMPSRIDHSPVDIPLAEMFHLQ